MTNLDTMRGAAKRIDDIDLPRIAHRIGVGEDELHAIIDVETRGTGFDRRGRPIILFEPHVFYRNLSGARRERAVREGLAYPTWGERPYPSDSYPRFFAARRIDEAAAIKACSWGLGQILGENYAMVGYPTPQAMVAAFAEDEEHHVEAMVAFMSSSGIDTHLRALARLDRPTRPEDCEPIVRIWNGPGYRRNDYHTKMAKAHNTWRAIVDTPWEPDADDLPPIGAKMVGPGSRGPDVRAVQMRFDLLGHYTGAIDGIYGPKTGRAIRSFQVFEDLAVDGYVGPETKDALAQVIERHRTRADKIKGEIGAPQEAPAPRAVPPRADLAGRPEKVVEDALRKEGSRTIAGADAVIKDALVNKLVVAIGGLSLTGLASFAERMPVWGWAAIVVGIVAAAVVAWRAVASERSATDIKRARIDDAMTGASARVGGR